MEEAMTESDAWWCKYNTDHQEVAEDEFKEDPDDEESHWEALEEAYEKILSSVDTTGFKDLTKVEI